MYNDFKNIAEWTSAQPQHIYRDGHGGATAEFNLDDVKADDLYFLIRLINMDNEPGAQKLKTIITTLNSAHGMPKPALPHKSKRSQIIYCSQQQSKSCT